MKLIETTFRNFRCFTHYKIEYGAETTVFFGKNGTGKSSVLSGIRRGLSFMFARSKNFSKNLAVSNNARVKPFEKTEANFDMINRSYNYPIDNQFKAQFLNENINWAMVKNSQNAGYSTTAYRDALQTVLGHYNADLKTALPVLAVITDSFPHEIVNFGAKAKQTVTKDVLPRDLAYYGWDARTSCLELWLNRFYRVSNYANQLQEEIKALQAQVELWESRLLELAGGDEERHYAQAMLSKLKERLIHLDNDERFKRFSNERRYIENKLLEFTRPLSADLDFINDEFELYRVAVSQIDKKNNTLEFNFKDGRVMSFEMLPMGYKRIFATVFDLAYRSYILNEERESQGIVMIDEIELHLHPTLQQDILQRFKRSFPHIQFIITTHSPLVLSNFKADVQNKIIRLAHRGATYSNEEVNNIFGIDYNTGLTEVMGANYRESELDNLIDSIVILTKLKKTAQVAALREELETIVGTNNRYIQDEIDKRIAQNNN